MRPRPDAPLPLVGGLRYFLDEFLEHINDKHCKAGQCQVLVDREKKRHQAHARVAGGNLPARENWRALSQAVRRHHAERRYGHSARGNYREDCGTLKKRTASTGWNKFFTAQQIGIGYNSASAWENGA